MSDPQLDIVEVFSELLDSVGTRIEGAAVVRVQSFDRAANTAEVTPQVLRGNEQPPNIQAVPVVFPGVRWDVQAGEYGLLITGGLNWRRWWRTGEVSPVEDTARHHLTNGILLVGVTPQSTPKSITANSSAVVKPVAGGHVKLGTYDADKAVVHEVLLGDLDGFFAALNLWGALVETATGVPWASVKAKVDTLIAGLLANSYRSPSVEVEE